MTTSGRKRDGPVGRFRGRVITQPLKLGTRWRACTCPRRSESEMGLGIAAGFQRNRAESMAILQRTRTSGWQFAVRQHKVPSTNRDMTSSSLLGGDDPAFALSADTPCGAPDHLSPRVIEAAICATHSGDKDVVPVAARLLGRARRPDAETEARVLALIRSGSPPVSLAAIQSASALGMPLGDYGEKRSRSSWTSVQRIRSRWSTLLASREKPLPSWGRRSVSTSPEQYASSMMN